MNSIRKPTKRKIMDTDILLINEEKKQWKEKQEQGYTLEQPSKHEEEPNEMFLVDPNTVSRCVSTLTIAVPGSILENAQTPALRAYLAGQIARAAVIYRVHEIVIFDDVEDEKSATFNGTSARYCTTQFAKLVQYLECPQYLRKKIFPLHKDLENAGIMNPLDCPHHLRSSDVSKFREGIVVSRQSKVTYVNVGLQKDVIIDLKLLPGIRVTVQLDSPNHPISKKLRGKVVTPFTPEIESGVYWGYTVRVAGSISNVFTQSPYDGGYDLTVGTSEKGKPMAEVGPYEIQPYSHALVVFGGLNGLEQAVESDPEQTVDDPMHLFNFYLNTCPDQGSNTIRTEEAVLITLAALKARLVPRYKYGENQF